MASIQKHRQGWRVQIDRRGVRLSRTFATKAAASAWAVQEERRIIDGEVSRWPKKTLGQALDRYCDEVSAKKRTYGDEVMRLAAFRRRHPALAAKILSEITAADISAWRDERLKSISSASVRREINLLRHLWRVAATEWMWCEDALWRSVKSPTDAPPRTRLISWQEARRILRRCGYRTGQRPITGLELTGYCFLIGLRTGMRAGEIVGLRGESVDLERRVVTLEKHKTMEAVGRRLVPLTPAGVRLLRVIWRPGEMLPISSRLLDALFRKIRDQVLLEDIHFHDSRATALTALSRRVDVLTLARISGHQDVSLLLRRYYRETAEQIAQRLMRG